MGKVQFSAAISEIRGKIGGGVFSKNRAGAYIRKKVTPVNPKSVGQIAKRALMATYSQTWRTITQAQRDAWTAAVSGYAKTNIFGDLRNPTGLQLYCKINLNLLNSGATAITTPAAPKGVSVVTIGVLTFTSGTPALSLARSGAVPAATRMIVYASPALSAGVNFVKSKLRIITTVAAATASPDNLLASWNTKFGAIGAVGTKIFVGIRFVDSTSGIASPIQLVSQIAAT